MEGLVKLMWIMDKHILDTAELQMNVLPVSLASFPGLLHLQFLIDCGTDTASDQ